MSQLLSESNLGSESAYLLAEKIIAGSACVLSVLGAFVVIFSFLFDNETRFKCKEVYYKICCGYKITEKNSKEKYKFLPFHIILINISVADIIVALSHLWGLCSNLEKEFHNPTVENSSTISAGYNISCTTQAGFTVISTLASFFWTDILVVFLAFNAVCDGCSTNFLTGFNGDEDGNDQEIGEDVKIDIPANVDAPNCCVTPCFFYVLVPLIGWGVPMVMTVGLAVHRNLGYTGDYDEGMFK